MAAPSVAFRLPRALAWAAALLFALAVLTPSVALARDVPPLTGHVNDTAHLLSAEADQRLEQKLTAYEAKTGQQFTLLTVDTLDGDALEDFSIRALDTWKLGKKGKDDGLILLIVPNDHLLRIEVGYGLEGELTDVFTSRVNRNVLTPAMRQGQPEAGVNQAFDLLMRQASGQAVDSKELAPPPQKDQGRPSPLGILALLFLLLPFVIPLLLARGALGAGRGIGRGGWGGGYGGWGGGGGGWTGGGGGGWGGGGGGGGFSGGGGGGGGGGSSGSW
jgi:uncharacterized protein